MPTGKEIMSRAGVLLNDTEHIRWPLSELCEWLNEGARAIVLAKPSAYSKTVVLRMAVGTRQTVPIVSGQPTPLVLIGLTRNITYTSTWVPGDPPENPIFDLEVRQGGRMIRRSDRSLLDAAEPEWNNQRKTQFRKEVRNYTYDELTPLEFQIYPGNDGTGYVEAQIGFLPEPLLVPASPDDIAGYDVPIKLPEPYSVPLLDYVLYRCQSKDDLDGQPGRGAMHYQQFATAIGLKLQVEKAHSPNARV